VLWPRNRRLAVFCQAGLQVTLPALERMVRRCEGSDRTEDRQEALALAAQMIGQWRTEGWYPAEQAAPSNAARMLGLLARLKDADHIERFVKRVIGGGAYGEGDNDALLSALVLLSVRTRAALLTLVVRQNAETRFGACCRLTARAIGLVPELEAAARHLLAAMPTKPEPQENGWRSSRMRPQVVADLLTALIAIDRELAESAISAMLASPAIYGMDTALIPALRLLMPSGHPVGNPAMVPLLAAVRSHLQARIAEPLAPPADWRRSSTVSCSCASCRQLSAFLDDPGQRTWILRAVEQVRAHVAHTIRCARPDLDTATERKGRPYSLICTKNQASYERRAAQRALDQADLALLGS
jgi:hypothetical protein